MEAELSVDGFDFDQYMADLADAGVEAFREEYDPGNEPHDVLSEVAFTVADETIEWDYDNVWEQMAILMESPHDPQEWEVFAEGADDWQEIVQGVAFTVVRQDFRKALEDRGYLDETWEPTDKLIPDEE